MIKRLRPVTDPWSILESEGHVPFGRVDCIFERFSPRERRCDGGGERASRAMRTTDSHSRSAKFAEIAAVIENVYRFLILDVAGEPDGSRAALHQRGARAEGNQRSRRLANRITTR